MLTRQLVTKLISGVFRIEAPNAPRVARPKRPGKPKRKWAYGNLRAEAHTKSEARAVFKGELGLRRLPIGAFVAELKRN